LGDSHHHGRDESVRETLTRELTAHIPYSVFSATFAIVLTGILTSLISLVDPGATAATAGRLFHCFHPTHMLLSAAATTAMFWRYDKGLVKAVLVGLVGSVGVCGISDVIMPFLGGTLLGVDMHLHLCVIEHPLLVTPFAAMGVIAGLLAADQIPRATFFSHSSHVLVSSMASVLYLVSFGLTDWVQRMGLVLLIVILAVVVPCCTSDILFPLAFTARSSPPAAGRSRST